MAYTRAWSEATPAGSDLAKNAPQDMQHIRTDIKERLMTPFQIDDFTTDPIKVNYVKVGYGTSTKGGHTRLVDDTGTYRWLAGLQANASATAYVIQDSVNNRVCLSIDASSGLVTAFALAVTSGIINVTRSAVNAQLTLNSSGGSGRSYSLISTTAGQFQMKDDTAGGIRWFMDSAGNITTVGSYSVGGVLYLLGDTAKNLSGNATDLTVINDNATGTIKLRTNGATRFTLDASGNIVATGNLTLATGLTVSAGGLSVTGGLTVVSGGLTVTGTFTLNSGMNVTGTAGFSSLVTFTGGYTVPSGAAATFGPSSATTGYIRMPNAAAIVWRNAANSANINGIYLDALNVMQIGSPAQVGGDLTVSSDLQVNATLTVVSSTVLHTTTIATGNLTITAGAIFVNGGFGSTFSGAVAITGALTANGAIDTHDNITVSGGSGKSLLIQIPLTVNHAGTSQFISPVAITNTLLVSSFFQAFQVYAGYNNLSASPAWAQFRIGKFASTTPPSNLNDGDMWYNANGLFFRKGGTTVTLA